MGIMELALQQIFSTSADGSLEQPKPKTPEATPERGGLLGGIEHVAEDHPLLSGIALAYADHKVNGRGILGSIFTAWAADRVFSGKADGVMGFVEKLWLANEAKNMAEKATPGDGIADTIAGWGTGVLSYMEMGTMERDARRRHGMAPT